SPEAAALPPVQLPVGGMGADGKATMVTVPAPLIDHFFFVNFQGQCFMGAIGKDPVVVKPLVPLLTQAVMSSKHAVGAIPIFFQTPLFQSGRSGGGIDVEVRGNE